MSCKHGNWDSCDECKAEDDLWDRAYKAGYEEGGKVSIDLTLKHLKRAEQAEAELAAIRSQPVPVEPIAVWQFRNTFNEPDRIYEISSDDIKSVVSHIDALLSRLQVAQQELNKLREETQHMIVPVNPCNCVVDSDNGEIAHLCKWHDGVLGGALKVQRMADALTVENVLKLPDDAKRRFIAHGIAESTARKQAEARNKRLVELFNNPSPDVLILGINVFNYSFGSPVTRCLKSFRAMSSELLREVDNGR